MRHRIGLSTAGVLSVMLAFATSVEGQTSLDLLGDMDCFGTGAACVEDDSWIPGLWGGESQSASDPSWSDDARFGTVSWTHTFTPVGAASLVFRTAGWADIVTWSLFADAMSIGTVTSDGFGHIYAETWSFALPASALADGSVTIELQPGSGGDLYAIDYSEIRGAAVSVPEPGVGLLLILGMLGLAVKVVREREPSRLT